MPREFCSGQYQIDQAQRREEELCEAGDRKEAEEESIAELMAKIKRLSDEIKTGEDECNSKK